MEKLKKSIIINLIVIVLVVMCSIFMFTGFKFMPGKTLLEISKIEMFKFYTVDSNLLVGIVSTIFVIYEIKLLNHKINEIPKIIYVLKHVSISAITLTFIVTLFFLAPSYGVYAMYNNNNLFLHLIIPVLSIFSYIFYEKYDNDYKYAKYGIIPMFIYSIYYIIPIIINLDNIDLAFKYDFYGFMRGNINNIYVVIPIIYLVTYLISRLLIFLNKKFS